jgi:hypothetical protein
MGPRFPCVIFFKDPVWLKAERAKNEEIMPGVNEAIASMIFGEDRLDQKLLGNGHNPELKTFSILEDQGNGQKSLDFGTEWISMSAERTENQAKWHAT